MGVVECSIKMIEIDFLNKICVESLKNNHAYYLLKLTYEDG